MRLGVLLATLRRHGVTQFSDGKIAVTLGPLPPTPTKAKAADKPEDTKPEPLPTDAVALAMHLAGRN